MTRDVGLPVRGGRREFRNAGRSIGAQPQQPQSRRIGDGPQPAQIGLGRQCDPRHVPVIGRDLQRLGPARGDDEGRVPGRAHRRKPLGPERLERDGKDRAAVVLDHDGQAHAQIGPRAVQEFCPGRSDGHAASSAAHLTPRRGK